MDSVDRVYLQDYKNLKEQNLYNQSSQVLLTLTPNQTDNQNTIELEGNVAQSSNE